MIQLECTIKIRFLPRSRRSFIINTLSVPTSRYLWRPRNASTGSSWMFMKIVVTFIRGYQQLNKQLSIMYRIFVTYTFNTLHSHMTGAVDRSSRWLSFLLKVSNRNGVFAIHQEKRISCFLLLMNFIFTFACSATVTKRKGRNVGYMLRRASQRVGKVVSWKSWLDQE